MKNRIRLSILILIFILITLNFAAVVQAMTSLQSAEGVIVVINQKAAININGTNYLITKEKYCVYSVREPPCTDV